MVQPGTGEVLGISQSRPMGRERKKGQTFLNYVVDNKYGDSGGFQAGSTFKIFVLAAALEQGLPTSTKFNSPAQVHIPQNDFMDCDGPYPVTSTWNPHNSTSNGTFDMYKGTQLSVNTYFAQLERKTGLCEPYALAKAMGVDLSNPAHERVPVVHARSRQRQPAGDGRRLRDRRRPRRALRRPTGHPGPERRRQGVQELPEAVQAGDAAVHRRHDQRHPQGRDGARRFRPVAHPGQAVGGQDRHHPGQRGRLVRRLHAGARDRRDDRRRQLPGAADHAERPERRRHLHRRRPRLHRGRPDVGPGDAGGAGQAARRDVHAAGPAPPRTRSRSRSPT